MAIDSSSGDLLRQTLAAELATVDAPQDTARRRDVVALYRRAGMAQPAEAELARLFAQFPREPGVLADMLDLRRDQRRMALLLPLIKAAKALPDRPEDLRLALAGACAIVGELDSAAEEFAVLLQTDRGRADGAAAIAAFVRTHPDRPALVSALVKLSYLHPDLLLPPPLRYAVFRAATERDPRLARQQLDMMFHPAIAETDLILDVATQAWRLGCWDRAARAAHQALKTCSRQQQTTAARLLVSVHSFAGKAGKAANDLDALPIRLEPVRFDEDVLAALQSFVADGRAVPDSSVRCATIVPYGDGRCRTFSHPHDCWDTASELLEAHPGALSVSVVEGDSCQTGPWEVLDEVDFIRPHLVVRLGRGQPFIHAFRAADDESVWPWQEVPIHVDGVPQDSQFRWLAAREAQAPEAADTRAAGLWQRIKAELGNLPKSIEGAEHDRTARLPGDSRNVENRAW